MILDAHNQLIITPPIAGVISGLISLTFALTFFPARPNSLCAGCFPLSCRRGVPPLRAFLTCRPSGDGVFPIVSSLVCPTKRLRRCA